MDFIAIFLEGLPEGEAARLSEEIKSRTAEQMVFFVTIFFIIFPFF